MKSKHRAGRKQKMQKDDRLIFQKKEERADFSKLVLNKIMTSDEKRVKCNFIAPLKFEFGLFISYCCW